MNLRDILIQPGPKPMRVVNKLGFAAHLEEAVMRILRDRLGKVDGTKLRLIQRDVRHEFLSQVRNEGRRVRGMPKEAFLAELERSRNRVVVDRDRARRELAKMQDRLAELRADKRQGSGAASNAVAVRTAGHDLERRLRSLFDVSQLAGTVPLEHERAILDFAAQAVTSELDRAGVAPEGDTEVTLLERRIGKLTKSLANMESQMHKLAKLKDVDPGIASEFRSVQGLSDLDDGFGQKKGLLHDIFIANQELRDALNDVSE